LVFNFNIFNTNLTLELTLGVVIFMRKFNIDNPWLTSMYCAIVKKHNLDQKKNLLEYKWEGFCFPIWRLSGFCFPNGWDFNFFHIISTHIHCFLNLVLNDHIGWRNTITKNRGITPISKFIINTCKTNRKLPRKIIQ
jgi:hypothetical protein